MFRILQLQVNAKTLLLSFLSFKTDEFNLWQFVNDNELLQAEALLTRSFQHSVSILTNILAFFLQHLLKILMIPSPVKYKQAKTTQQQIHSHVKKVHVSRFPVVSNETIQEINIRSLSTRWTKQGMNERSPKLVLVPIPSSWKIYLETNGAARTWQGPEYKVLRRGHKKKQRY